MSYIYNLGPKSQNERVVTIIRTEEDLIGSRSQLNSESVKISTQKADEFVHSYNAAAKKDNWKTFFKILAGGVIVGSLGCFCAPKLVADAGATALKETKIFLGSCGALLGGLLGACFHNTSTQDKVCEKLLHENS